MISRGLTIVKQKVTAPFLSETKIKGGLNCLTFLLNHLLTFTFIQQSNFCQIRVHIFCDHDRHVCLTRKYFYQSYKVSRQRGLKTFTFMYTKLFYCFKISAFEHMIFRVNVYRKPNLAKNWSFAFRLMAKMKML